jgi:elongation factor G
VIGFPMVDMKVTLFDGAFHHVDSSAAAFEVAARQAMLEGCRKAGVNLLEPIMNIEVVTPNDLVGAVTGDVTARRGRNLHQQRNGNKQTITADVPLAELVGYQRHLHSITDGLASCTMRLSHFAEVRRRDDPDDFPPAVGARA